MTEHTEKRDEVARRIAEILRRYLGGNDGVTVNGNVVEVDVGTGRGVYTLVVCKKREKS